LQWMVEFPDKGLTLDITAVVKNQEMPILGPGGGIWEGLCNVGKLHVHLPHFTRSQRRRGRTDFLIEMPNKPSGVAYMELVGYNSPAVKARVGKGR
ncbi:MAG: lipocalin family protein, partial [Armatimonadota bacterium]|nr:lipocalin family protein [Armatimonadota bacterium]